MAKNNKFEVLGMPRDSLWKTVLHTHKLLQTRGTQRGLWSFLLCKLRCSVHPEQVARTKGEGSIERAANRRITLYRVQAVHHTFDPYHRTERVQRFPWYDTNRMGTSQLCNSRRKYMCLPHIIDSGHLSLSSLSFASADHIR